jgi:hypothetical protein
MAGWWFGTWILFSIYGISLPIDELIFFRMVQTTNEMGISHFRKNLGKPSKDRNWSMKQQTILTNHHLCWTNVSFL